MSHMIWAHVAVAVAKISYFLVAITDEIENCTSESGPPADNLLSGGRGKQMGKYIYFNCLSFHETWID
jgi:hypothetical protein